MADNNFREDGNDAVDFLVNNLKWATGANQKEANEVMFYALRRSFEDRAALGNNKPLTTAELAEVQKQFDGIQTYIKQQQQDRSWNPFFWGDSEIDEDKQLSNLTSKFAQLRVTVLGEELVGKDVIAQAKSGELARSMIKPDGVTLSAEYKRNRDFLQATIPSSLKSYDAPSIDNAVRLFDDAETQYMIETLPTPKDLANKLIELNNTLGAGSAAEVSTPTASPADSTANIAPTTNVVYPKTLGGVDAYVHTKAVAASRDANGVVDQAKYVVARNEAYIHANSYFKDYDLVIRAQSPNIAPSAARQAEFLKLTGQDTASAVAQTEVLKGFYGESVTPAIVSAPALKAIPVQAPTTETTPAQTNAKPEATPAAASTTTPDTGTTSAVTPADTKLNAKDDSKPLEAVFVKKIDEDVALLNDGKVDTDYAVLGTKDHYLQTNASQLLQASWEKAKADGVTKQDLLDHNKLLDALLNDEKNSVVVSKGSKDSRDLSKISPDLLATAKISQEELQKFVASKEDKSKDIAGPDKSGVPAANIAMATTKENTITPRA